jgi:hypothetical protein
MDFEDGTGYDWHFSSYWRGGTIPIKLYGEGTDTNTNPIYGYYGVANREERLRKLGLPVQKVYIANHTRAILDLVYEYLTKFRMIGYAKGCVEDIFFNKDHAIQLFKQLVKMRAYPDEDRRDILDDWLAREFKPFYRSWKAGTLQVGENPGYRLRQHQRAVLP